MDNHAGSVVFTSYGFNVEGLFSALGSLVGGGGTGAAIGIVSLFYTIWFVYSIIAFLVAAFFMFVYIYAKIRFSELFALQTQMLHDAEHHTAEHNHTSKNQRWENAAQHIESDNPNDWRLAIIEADIMLDELLDALGLPGITIGDKLKGTSPNFMKTLDDAWKAHRTRNDIAHRGSDFILTKRLARETLEQYRRVFQEFAII